MKTKTWLVVKVERGFPAAITVCENEAAAFQLQERIEQRMNPDYDSAGVFCIDLKKKLKQDVVYC